MATYQRIATRADRRSRMLRQNIAEEVASRRIEAGLSLREVGRRGGLSPDTVLRIERAEPGSMTIDNVGRIGGVLGLELAARLYPNGDPVRDRAHLALLNRFRSRLGPGITLRTEVAIPIPGDRRSGDGVLSFGEGDILVEAETRVSDAQGVERRARAKARDLGAIRLVLLLADTRHNRHVIAMHPELLESFPTTTRPCLDALKRSIVPLADAIVFL